VFGEMKSENYSVGCAKAKRCAPLACPVRFAGSACLFRDTLVLSTGDLRLARKAAIRHHTGSSVDFRRQIVKFPDFAFEQYDVRAFG